MRLTLFLILLCSFNANASSLLEKGVGVEVNDNSFPWDLVIDRGKILGCIYNNQFYSLGSILILESLPRICNLAKDRNGIWEQLAEDELLLYKENIEAQQNLERESTYIGGAPINREEARLIRYLRSVKKLSDKKSH